MSVYLHNLSFNDASNLLEVDKICMSFGGLRAIDNVSFNVKQHEIFGLIGPNGAGKTTMFNVITANYKPTSGEVRLMGDRISNLKPNKILQKGIARTFQNIRLFSSMSVLENVLIGLHHHAKYTFFEAAFRFGRFFSEEKKIKQKALEILEYLKIQDLANQSAVNLSYGNQRKVEIARAIASSPKLLLLDEPVAGMNPSESEELAQIILQLRKDFALSVLVIEHDMPFVNALCDRVLVLDFGKILFLGTPQEAIKDSGVIEAYLGDFHAKD